jgi:structural maintenance of chromosome 2
MFIKQIVIDGFKSYAQRTVIDGFDPTFNAVTGLNGSGKSNILDAICFLLGITNLSQVRATSLQELVYKSGQAGVTKATVTITFDNSDKQQSPLGYESFNELTVTRQVVIGGRNKYMVNGVTANNARVQDLFRSVQLNVNNPHFLIMQGRITKVLNMKPPEVLSMIEEAAGTRMYESKKASAQKTIEKKDSKLLEISSILVEEITPTLQRLREERSSYLEYQKVTREIEHLTRLVTAFRFVRADEVRMRSTSDLEEMNSSLRDLRGQLKEINSSMSQLCVDIKELERKRDEKSGGALRELEGKVDEDAKVVVKAKSALDHCKEELSAEKRTGEDLRKTIKDDEASLKEKEDQCRVLSDEFVKLEEMSSAANQLVKEKRDRFQAISAGLSASDSGEEKTLAEQLSGCKNDISVAQAEMQQAEMRLQHAQGELKKQQATLKDTEPSYRKEKARFDDACKAREQLQMEMARLNYTEGKEEELTTKRRQIETAIHQLRKSIASLESRFPQLQFDYTDPEKGFNRATVHGPVAKLIKVRDVTHATALEVAAGGKLYNIVVDSEMTGKKLLQKGKLKRRYTIIPLNKIAAKTINPQTIQRAKQLVGADNAHTALSLVGYDEEVEAAMQFVFGRTFVCSTMNTAKQVTFDSKVMTRSVTLDGELFDPSGTLSGGARPSSATVLTALDEIHSAELQLSDKLSELSDISHELESVKARNARYNEMKKELNMKQQELDLLESKLKQTKHHQMMETVKSLQQTLAEQEKVLCEAKKTVKEATAKRKELEKKIKDSSGHHERELKQAEEEMNQAQREAESVRQMMNNKRQEQDEIKLEGQELTTELESLKKQILKSDQTIKTLEAKLKQHRGKVENLEELLTASRDALASQKSKLKACSKEITERSKALKSLERKKTATQLKIKELEHSVDRHQKETRDAAHLVKQLTEKHSWIETERKFFGKANTAYDFKAHDPKDAESRLGQLEQQKTKLARTVNMRAMNMLEKAEERYQDLMRKKEIVENDKAKIAEVIQELDKKKEEALHTAFEKVNRDFGSIFSTLLPGAGACLSPPDGLTVLDGLEVRVAFGDVWKESLTELSGGQRSLVALSLILSLLLFKPAPLYILDEIDAALDLSHTQNIGQMLRNHFQHSQFIIVSLKEGMFHNANVLFKTRFVDGVSTVTRYVQNITAARAPAPISENQENAGRKAKRQRIDQRAVLLPHSAN